jgi:hypothetical protein
MKTMLKQVICVLFLMHSFTIFSQQVNLISSSWKQLAFLNVNSSISQDHILIHANDTYQKIKLTVLDAPIEIIDLVIVYENGEQSKIAVRSVIMPGRGTREFALSGKLRRIKSFEISYNAATRNGKIAKLSIWGI